MHYTPLVSVIIPVYNGENFIKEAIDSVIAQTYKNIEIIVVDDGSTDGTYQVISEYIQFQNIFFLQHENSANLGVSKTRKFGIENSRGKYVSFLDADDFFFPNKIELQVQIMEEKSSLVLCHSSVQYQSENNLVFPHDYVFSKSNKQYQFLDLDNYLTINPIFNSSVLVKKELLIEINFSMPQLFQFEDWITWILLAEKGSFYYISEELAAYRYHDTSSTYKYHHNVLKQQFSWLEFYFCLLTKISDERIVQYIYQEMEKRLFMLIKTYDDNDLAFKNMHKFLKGYSSSEILQLQNKLKDVENKYYSSKLFKVMNFLNSSIRMKIRFKQFHLLL
jgi:teichuronic acid biosynthesis glycosyltransferase TuaG